MYYHVLSTCCVISYLTYTRYIYELCLALVDAFIRLNILYPRVQITDDKKENAQTG